MSNETNKLCITVKEGAKLCGCSYNTFRQIVHRKDFPKIICGRRILIPYDAFKTWLNTCYLNQ